MTINQSWYGEDKTCLLLLWLLLFLFWMMMLLWLFLSMLWIGVMLGLFAYKFVQYRRKAAYEVMGHCVLLEQRRIWMKVWKKRRKKGFKSHIAQDKHLNNVSLPIYREPLSSFFLVPVEKHFLNFSFSLPYFSRCISGKLLPLSFCRSKISVGYKSDFLSHNFGWL